MVPHVTTPGSGTDTSSGVDPAVVAGVIIALVLVIIVIVVAVFVYIRRKKMLKAART